MVKSEGGKKTRGNQWYRIFIGAAVVVLLAIVFVPRNSPASFIDRIKSCYCSQEGLNYHGLVEDCYCEYETVDRINVEVLYPVLQQIVNYPFFRYFKVKLGCDCPFWPDDSMCYSRDCGVCDCPENQFPETFRKPSGTGLSSDKLVCQEEKPEAAVNRTVDAKAFKGWMEVDNPWTNDDETDNAEMTYVDLQLNHERNTGYTGPSARRIWDAIYLENCHKYPSEDCQEKRILYKLISGLHSSISIHIAAEYHFEEETNMWGQNLSLMYDRVLKYPDRVRNLYFTFLFVLRSVIKAKDYLEQADYDTGNPSEDMNTQLSLKKLLNDHELLSACPKPFDEAKLWKGQSGPELMKQTQRQFRNISALMDCVGCGKCRLWGKLQVLGLGTALKILFSVNGDEPSGQQLQLQRNEVIASINLLNRLSESVKLVHEMGPLAERIHAGIEADVVSIRQGRSSFIYQFTQQNLPACKPVLSPAWVVSIFLVVGVLFIPAGVVCLHASRSVVEIVYRYDVECVPEPFKGNKLAYIENDFIPKNCTKFLKVPRDMKAPIYVYYQLDNYYQNHRRIEEDLDADDIISVNLLNNYNTYSFNGSKKIVLSTSSWFGGHNNFLGIAYISIGSSFIFIACLFLLLHIKNPRSYGDTSNISWNWKHISD
ncbi:endoplasmic reticulum oxidoreductins 1 [Perilla frutescens var. hirtella]|uniref:Endoplasmic reticulum oxidoreductins 1 n=1 Tax=Perilla frutescens var. hirtella TaxID=608512 RepID=A0AAD4P4Z4_PERFH|nr:endoplasmic reticulum oxidoreductins 1 [Perilla frutescens var. hirtella]